jgi:hypothetical protein
MISNVVGPSFNTAGLCLLANTTRCPRSCGS